MGEMFGFIIVLFFVLLFSFVCVFSLLGLERNTKKCRKAKKPEQPDMIIIPENDAKRLFSMCETLGHKCLALGVDEKIVPSGVCTDDVLVDEKKLIVGKCVFCKGGYCCFTGECERRKELDK